MQILHLYSLTTEPSQAEHSFWPQNSVTMTKSSKGRSMVAWMSVKIHPDHGSLRCFSKSIGLLVMLEDISPLITESSFLGLVAFRHHLGNCAVPFSPMHCEHLFSLAALSVPFCRYRATMHRKKQKVNQWINPNYCTHCCSYMLLLFWEGTSQAPPICIGFTVMP